MGRAVIDGIELHYEERGAGEPVLLVHPGIFTDWFEPMLRESALGSRYRLVTYHRAGCGQSARGAGPLTVAQQAAHGRRLLEHLGVSRAHVVGHSSSANLVLQLAVDAPEVVHSLALLEPALMSVPSAATSRVFVGKAVEQYRSGDDAAAVDTFLRGTCGSGYREILDRALPGGFARYVSDASTFFESELRALQGWSFGAGEARRIDRPALAVVGARSLALDPIWGERHQLLLDWLPRAEACVLSDVGHLLEVEDPRGVGEALGLFWGRHAMNAR